jgi:phage-related protein
VGIGREVADAYISVHGDLSPFRRSLSGAQKDIEKAAKNNADTYAEAWGKRLEKQTGDRWNSIVDAMYSQEKLDINKMIEHFDPTDLDNAQTKINKFLLDMSRNQHLTGDYYKDVKRDINAAIEGMRERNRLDAENEQQLRGLSMALEANSKFLADANKENERWARTLDGIRKNNAIGDMEGDFRKLAGTMKSADFADFAKGFDTFTELRKRVYDVTAAMQEQGRMSDEQAAVMRENVNMFIRGEHQKSDAMRETLAETNRLKKAQDEYNGSLSGMARNFHIGKLENDFRNLAAAMDSNDFSHFARGADNLRDMRLQIANTANEMRRLGRMTDQEYLLVLQRTTALTHSFNDNDGAMKRSIITGARLRKVFSGMGRALRGTREHLQGFAGLNVFGDMIREGLDFIHNLDRIAVSASKAFLKVGALGSVAGSSLAGLFVIATDLGAVIGGLGAALPGFLVAAGISGGVLYAALKDMKTVLKDLTPQFKKLQDTISSKFWAQAKKPITDLTKALMPLLTTKLGATGTAWGKVFGSLADSIKAIPQKRIAGMFDRMNKGIDIAAGAMPPLIRAFTNLGDAASRQFERFGTWIKKISTDFDKFIQKASDNGDLDKWINNMVDGFKNLGRAADGTFGIINAISDAAKRAGSGGLKEFADKLQGIAKAMQERGFQDTLTTFISGMNIAVGKMGEAIKGLGPALQSVMPSIKIALSDVGDSVATIIGYLGQILSNPTVQKGITDFSNGVKTALGLLAPAVKPFADSLGNAMSLLGKVVESVAKIATAFTVNLAPVLDQMSIKVQTLLDPLSNMATNAIEKLKPVADALDKFIVGPIVAAMNSSLIPSFNGFVDKASPVLAKIVEDLGPVLKSLVNDVLPNAVKFATELLDPLGKVFDLFTPALKKQIDDVAGGFSSLSAAMRIAKGEARTEDWGTLFGAFSMDGFNKAQKAYEEQIKNAPKTDWGDIFGELLGGNAQNGMAIAWNEKIYPELVKAGQWLDEHVNDGLDRIFGNGQFWKDAASNNIDLSKGLTDWLKGQFDEIGRANEELSGTITTALNDWWGGIKGMAQDWFKSTFGFGNDSSKPAGGSISGGGGAGGKGMGVMGKITEEMLGNTGDPATVVTEPFAGISQAINDSLAQINGVVGGLTGALGEIWNGFWGGFGTVVSDVWTNITTWIGTFAGQIGANIASFIGTVSTTWNSFWAGVGQTVSSIWTQITTWISTTVGQIAGNIGSFIGTVTANWNAFWAGVGQTVSAIWAQITGWIGQQIGAIAGNIGNFIGTVTSNWNNFWSGVGAKVSQTWAQITGWINQQVGAIIGRIAGFIGQVTGSWNAFWGGVSARASQAWAQISGAVSNGVSSVIGWVAGLPGRISGAIGNAWGILQGAGEAIMGGLRRGLESAWSGVQNFVGTIAQWIADHKGPISYDRTLLVPAGEAIMSGLETSMKDKFGNVMDFVSSMASMMASAFNHSDMYIAGKNASQGLADGLLANKSTIAAAYSNLGTFATGDPAGLGTLKIARGDDRSSGTTASHSFAPGAVQVAVTTQATDAGLVASKVTDSLDDAFARFSGL